MFGEIMASENRQGFADLRDFTAALFFVLLDKEIITLEEWKKYQIQAKHQLEQLDTKEREKAIANMTEGERFLYKFFQPKE